MKLLLINQSVNTFFADITNYTVNFSAKQRNLIFALSKLQHNYYEMYLYGYETTFV